MVLSKREKYIGIGAAAAVVLLGITTLVIDPYFSKLDSVEADRRAAQKTLSDNADLLRAQKGLQDGWQQMMSSGLQADDSMAQSQTQQALQTWARSASINLDALSSERAPAQKGAFQAINFNLEFNAAGQQSMRQIARMLWAVESAALPIRLNDLRIQSTREGTDQLNVKLVVSALYMPPSASDAASGAGLFDDTGELP